MKPHLDLRGLRFAVLRFAPHEDDPARCAVCETALSPNAYQRVLALYGCNELLAVTCESCADLLLRGSQQ